MFPAVFAGGAVVTGAMAGGVATVPTFWWLIKQSAHLVALEKHTEIFRPLFDPKTGFFWIFYQRLARVSKMWAIFKLEKSRSKKSSYNNILAGQVRGTRNVLIRKCPKYAIR